MIDGTRGLSRGWRAQPFAHSFLGHPFPDDGKADLRQIMLVRPFRRLLAVFATLSLVCTLVVTACPTCDIDVHAAIPSADECREDGPLVNDWQAGADGRACCESDGCGDGEELPRGLIQRTVSASPTTVCSSTSRRSGCR